MVILIDGVRYILKNPDSEDNLEKIIEKNYKYIFGENSFYFNLKRKLKSKSGIGSIPDGYLIIFNSIPEWCILEVELASHPLYDHIIPQLTKFIRGIEDISTKNSLIDMFYNEIKTNLILEAKIKKKIGSGEIYKFVSDLISVKPKIIIAINERTNELKEAIRDIRADVKILEFKIFRREGISEEIDAYLFNPVIDFKNIEKPPIIPKPEEGKKYTEEYHTKKTPENIVELYNEFKEKILDLADGITIRPRKRYIGFIAKTNFTDVLLQKSKIKITLNLKKGIIDDPKKLARDISNVGHWGNGDYEINISNDENLEYIISLVKQAYLKHK